MRVRYALEKTEKSDILQYFNDFFRQFPDEDDRSFSTFLESFPSHPFRNYIFSIIEPFSVIGQQTWFYGKPLIGWIGKDNFSHADSLIVDYISMLLTANFMSLKVLSMIGVNRPSLFSQNSLSPLFGSIPLDQAFSITEGVGSADAYLRKCKSRGVNPSVEVLFKYKIESINKLHPHLEGDDFKMNLDYLEKIDSSDNRVLLNLAKVAEYLVVQNRIVSGSKAQRIAKFNLLNLLTFILQMKVPGRNEQCFSNEEIKLLHDRGMTRMILYPDSRTWNDFFRHNKRNLPDYNLQPITELFFSSAGLERCRFDSEVINIFVQLTSLLLLSNLSVIPEVEHLEDSDVGPEDHFNYLIYNTERARLLIDHPGCPIQQLETLFERTGMYNYLAVEKDTGNPA